MRPDRNQLRLLSWRRFLLWLPAILLPWSVSFRSRSLLGWTLLLTTVAHARARGNRVSVGRRFRTRGLAVKFNGRGNRVEIGDDVAWSGSIEVIGDGLTIRIGDRCDAKRTKMIARRAGISIGSDCLLAADTEVRTSDIHTIFDLRTRRRINPAAPVEIGDSVWIAGHASILKGARVPDHCVVGTRSVVTRAFDEKNCVIAGVPARVVRSGVYWRR